MKIIKINQDFWDHTFRQTEFAKDGVLHGFIIETRGQIFLKREGLMLEAKHPMFNGW